MERGVRQGDPLSPLLFIISMEGLNIAIKTTCEKGIFTGISLPNTKTSISHLFYMDDALFMGEWHKENIKNLARILRCFHVTSGLKVNFHKSHVIRVGFDMNEVTRYATPLRCEPAKLPFNYLGVPVGGNMKLKKNWRPVIERFQGKLSVWKSKTLSMGGRLTLCKVVLDNLPTYYITIRCTCLSHKLFGKYLKEILTGYE